MLGEKVARNHSEACRDRIAQRLMADGDTRVMRDIDRAVEQRDLVREIVKPESAPVIRNEELECEDDSMEGIEEENEVVMKDGDILRLGMEDANEDRVREMNDKAGKFRNNWKEDVRKM